MRSVRSKLNRDRVFWLVIGGVFVLYAIVAFGSAVPFLATILALIVAITVHECAHAWAADQLGDPTARFMGRVSLNPLVHLDPMGTVMMIVTTLTGMGIGWGKSTPVTPYRLKYGSRTGGGIVGLVGPAANLLLATVLGLLLRVLGPSLSGLWVLFLNAIVVTNIIIAVFNFLPFPPLDGHAVLIGLLNLVGQDWAWNTIEFLEGLRRYGPMILLAVILFSQFLGINLIGWLIGPPSRFLYALILGGRR